jgi:hypothetical protein
MKKTISHYSVFWLRLKLSTFQALGSSVAMQLSPRLTQVSVACAIGGIFVNFELSL